MENISTFTVATLFGLTAAVTHAEDPADGRWRVGLGYRPFFDLDVSFRNAGAAPAAHNPSVTGKSYTDGFVGLDSTGNALGLTTYWGYQRPEQYAGDAIALRNSQPGDQWANGFELSAGRALGQSRNLIWGVEGGFS